MPEQPPVSDALPQPLAPDALPEADRPWSPTHLVNFESPRLTDDLHRALVAYDYAWVRLVPRVETGEFINVGVLIFARQHDFLAARVELDVSRLAALCPDCDPAAVDSALKAFTRVAEGDAEAGPMAALPKSERFGWLVAPSSTVIQCSPTHTGLCTDPQQALDELFADLVL